MESVSQFAEPVGHTLARLTLTKGTLIEGEIQWMNATGIKLRTEDGSELVVVKENVSHIEALDGQASVSQADFVPDRWAGQVEQWVGLVGRRDGRG